ncbi:MAG TPA: carboxypeptidase-like regulatory domain-containing protein [Bryobacteraceae bacterium]|nr:carboxypeptidase-like regulatory domain-containing protein [Bryobacteraceae bacterium]
MVGRSIALVAVLQVTALAQMGSVKGVVVDSTGAFVPFVDVELRIKGKVAPVEATKTDAKGHFGFAAVTPGTYELLVSGPGFDRHSQSIRVVEAQDTEVPTISLVLGEIAKCGPPRLELPTIDFERTQSSETMLDGAVVGMDRAFLAGVTITLSPIGKNTRQWTMVTGAWGSFSFSGITPGMYALRATHRGYSDFVIDRFEIKAGQRTHISEPLEMLDCPDGFRCNPNRKIHVVEICL